MGNKLIAIPFGFVDPSIFSNPHDAALVAVTLEHISYGTRVQEKEIEQLKLRLRLSQVGQALKERSLQAPAML